MDKTRTRTHEDHAKSGVTHVTYFIHSFGHIRYNWITQLQHYVFENKHVIYMVKLIMTLIKYFK